MDSVLFIAVSLTLSCSVTRVISPPNGPVLFCLLASVVVCNTARGRAGRVGGRVAALHGGPVCLHPVRATPCFYMF